MTTADIWKIAITGSGVLVGLLTLIKGVIEYIKQGTTKRAEIFLNMRTRLREDEGLAKICDLLETDDIALREISLVERDRFTGFFEELALLHNSRLISREVTLYMFGYFAIRCAESDNFWYGLNKTQPLWSAFFDFANQMKEAQKEFKFVRKKYRL